MRIRCRNCGLWHDTRNCPRYGPMYPAPGKTSADYSKVAKEIADRVAADIIAEHEGGEADEGDEVKIRYTRRKKPKPA